PPLPHCPLAPPRSPYPTLFRSLRNTGFAQPQLADVAERENVAALVHDEEFTELLSTVSPGVERYLAWVEPDTDRDEGRTTPTMRSEEHTSELQSRFDLVCRPLL